MNTRELIDILRSVGDNKFADWADDSIDLIINRGHTISRLTPEEKRELLTYS